MIQQDDPRATQPLTYQKIQNHPTTLQIYSEKLVGEGIITHDVRNLFPQPFFACFCYFSRFLCPFLEFFEIPCKTSLLQLGDHLSKFRSLIVGPLMWTPSLRLSMLLLIHTLPVCMNGWLATGKVYRPIILWVCVIENCSVCWIWIIILKMISNCGRYILK